MSEKLISRRKLIKDTSIAAIGSAILLNNPLKVFAASGNSEALTKVVLIRNKAVLDENRNIDATVLKQMLNDALMELTGQKSAPDAWKQIIKPTDVVGIKTNVWKHLGTPVALEESIKEGIKSVGVAEADIAVDDRGVLNNPVFQRSTALINTRPMRTHAWAGVGSLVKNYIMFSPKPASYHDDSCADLGLVWDLPNVKGKTRLNVLVMLTPLFHGIGPHNYNEDYVWSYGGLLVGFDPVAVDSVGLRIIEAKRNQFFSEPTPLNPPAKHIGYADTRHHIGTADAAKINLVRMGWEEGVLI